MTGRNMSHNENDKKIWDYVFSNIPVQIKCQPAIGPINDCIAFFREEEVASVLDLGCGVGLWSVFLARSGFQGKGFDFSQTAIEFATSWAKEENLSLEFVCAPLTANPFKNEKFDAALAALILDNVTKEEMSEAICELKSVVKDNGVVFALFNPFLTPEQLERMSKNNPTKDATSVIYTDEELRNAFQNFEILEFKTYPELHNVRALKLRNRLIKAQ